MGGVHRPHVDRRLGCRSSDVRHALVEQRRSGNLTPVIWVVIVVLALIAAAGFGAQRLLHRERLHDDPRAQVEGLPISELVIPVRTLATLLLAFVLVAVFQSYQLANDKAAEEAGAVLSMAEEAVLLTPDARRDVLGQMTCYARSVAGPDWRSQAEGLGPSPATDAAADNVALALQRALAAGDNEVAISSILSSNSLRIQTRIQRINEARPSVPGLVWGVLIATVAASIGGLAAFGHPGVRRRIQLAVLAGTTVVFVFTLVVVQDLDRPYDGPVRIEPTGMLDVARRIAALPGGDLPPCQADGTPL